MDDIAIKVDNLTKVFKLPHEKNTSIKSAVVNFYKPHKKGYELQQALKDVSFEVKKGEFFGIVGRNGSGKSTLLKMLAGIYTPTAGSIQVNGALTPFIELGVGFNMELTGRENVFLNGALLGFSRKEMHTMYNDIVEFAELEKFMDQKLKNYSSGMQVRLAFSIAIRAQSDILLIDEVLAVGDEAFQRKCFRYFDKLKKESKTVVFVTHDMDTFDKYCDSGILIEVGKIIYRGEPLLVSAEYRIINSSKARKKIDKNTALKFDGSIKAVSLNGEASAILKNNDVLKVEIDVESKKNITASAGISIIRSDGVYVAFQNNRNKPAVKLTAGKPARFRYEIDSNQFMPGSYSVDVALYDRDDNYIDLKSQAGIFVVVRNDKTRAGIINLKGNWDFDDKP